MKLATKIFKRSDWYVTSNFGWRIHPISKVKKYHYGTDYGTNVKKWAQYAIEDGYVHIVHSTDNGGYGKYIWVRYPRIDRSLLHAHLDSIVVKKGDKVKAGTLLGYTGTTGNSTGIHLHLGMTKIGSNTYLNPHTYDYVEEVILPTPVEKNEEVDQLYVPITTLRVRKTATTSVSTNILGFAKVGYYNSLETTVADGYTWHKVGENMWLAQVSRTTFYPKKEEIVEPIEEPIAEIIEPVVEPVVEPIEEPTIETVADLKKSLWEIILEFIKTIFKK